MGKNKLNTKEQFSEAWTYIKETKNYIFFAIILFLVSTAFGYFFKNNLTFLDEVLKNLLIKTQGLDTPGMIFFILQNNLESAIFSILGGILFGIFPITNILANGAVLGYVLAISAEKVGFGVWWRILPHGIFELPAILISFGMAIKLGCSLFKDKETRIETLKQRFYNSANAFLLIIIPLLIIAAIIEGILIGVLS
jgi:stage II sporulation protein M